MEVLILNGTQYMESTLQQVKMLNTWQIFYLYCLHSVKWLASPKRILCLSGSAGSSISSDTFQNASWKEQLKGLQMKSTTIFFPPVQKTIPSQVIIKNIQK